MLIKQGQQHLFADWPDSGVDDVKKMNFFSQVERLDANYPGGLEAYIQNAKALLADSKAGRNPFAGYIPTVPDGEHLTFGEKNFLEYEEIGVKEAWKTAFVLVAGGLGERLGYNGIKIALSSESTTGRCFLHLYIKSILALQRASIEGNEGAKNTCRIPLVIMTSEDTHAKTQQLLIENNYFGMLSYQVVLLKQEKVACFQDNEARLALDPSDKYIIQTKPHGHGDVHTLLFQSGLLSIWEKKGIEWVLFFQDTNGLLFKAIPAALGVSAQKNLDVNSLAVPRKAKEAIGGICRLTHENGTRMVINVEYNQLDPLLRATGHLDGDVNDASGFSPYPGNINQLIIKLGPYMEELARTNGAIKEFVNPKYKDASKMEFKSSTRLECMMQDYPRTLGASANVGFTVMDAWLAYSPVKNNPEDAAKVPKGNPPHSATSGEMAIYRANSLILRHAGVEVEGPKMETFNGQEVEVWPRIVWSPEWGVTYSTLKSKLLGTCSVSQKSTLVLDGKDIVLDDVNVNGTLVVSAVEDAKVKLHSWRVENSGWVIESVNHKDTNFPEEVRLRGFTIKRLDQEVINIEEAGNFELRQKL
ncbi:hypothetical protein GOP47_0016668 [Adiantum capillus-veneris]|uniref:UTP-monosaccharide-1-phosphate uridylyltransferase n=1 Tax=Adiantum capillus-veneris TaxID=13818 RepID=A0A9D4UI41_ADICA|nr:hypothetical protein GOP47_0016668 [Adiantum capillus-veneris]